MQIGLNLVNTWTMYYNLKCFIQDFRWTQQEIRNLFCPSNLKRLKFNKDWSRRVSWTFWRIWDFLRSHFYSYPSILTMYVSYRMEKKLEEYKEQILLSLPLFYKKFPYLSRFMTVFSPWFNHMTSWCSSKELLLSHNVDFLDNWLI